MGARQPASFFWASGESGGRGTRDGWLRASIRAGDIVRRVGRGVSQRAHPIGLIVWASLRDRSGFLVSAAFRLGVERVGMAFSFDDRSYTLPAEE